MLTGYFRLKELGTTVRQEVIAGITTFVTMAYIIVVNPKILEAAGMPFGPSMVATILTASIGTLLMGLYAKRPFAIAPYMGENAFVAFTVVKVMGFSWQQALGAIFLSGAVFALLTVLNIRSWLVNSIPTKLKIGFSVGIGLFLTFIGLNETGIVRLGVPGALRFPRHRVADGPACERSARSGHRSSDPDLHCSGQGASARQPGWPTPVTPARPWEAGVHRAFFFQSNSGHPDDLRHDLCGYHGNADWPVHEGGAFG
jgi:hypothetical protein